MWIIHPDFFAVDSLAAVEGYEWPTANKMTLEIISIITTKDGLVQERRNSSALAMELRLSCTNPSIYNIHLYQATVQRHNAGAMAIVLSLWSHGITL